MPVDQENPSVPPAPPPVESESLLAWRTRNAAATERNAAAVERLAIESSGTPATEGGIFLSLLNSVLVGRLTTNSDDAIIWAKDLTKEYLLRYTLLGEPKVAANGQSN